MTDNNIYILKQNGCGQTKLLLPHKKVRINKVKCGNMHVFYNARLAEVQNI